MTFTGLLDHRYAPGVLAAMDVQVVPSILEEAFGMVAAEGAAAGALPLVARHSGLAEVAAAFETDVGRPGLFSFEPGEGAVGRLAQGIDRLLSLPERTRRPAGRRQLVRGTPLDVGTDGRGAARRRGYRLTCDRGRWEARVGRVAYAVPSTSSGTSRTSPERYVAR